MTFSLEKVHAVESEGFDFHDGVAGRDGGLGDFGGDVEGCGGAGFVFNVYGNVRLLVSWR